MKLPPDKPYQPYTRILFRIFLFWLLLYTWFWTSSTSCEVADMNCRSAGLHDWFEKLISLRWVATYQSLIAGFLAVGAAALFLVVPILERQLDERRTLRIKRQRFKALMAELINHALKASDAVIDGNASYELTLKTRVAELTDELGTFNVALPSIIATGVEPIERGIRWIAANHDKFQASPLLWPDVVKVAWVFAAAMRDFFSRALDMDLGEDGTILFPRAPAAELARILEIVHLNRDQIPSAILFYDPPQSNPPAPGH
jgi:hypothetical protein